ncbi:MAG: hypothetical protein QXY10_00855 [Candidatus Micrarchaeaceae archaeon]
MNIIEKAIDRYGLPKWLLAYVADYIKADPMPRAKRLLSFAKTEREMGSIKQGYIMLPNGMYISMEFIGRVLSVFYYGEKKSSEIYAKWAERGRGIGNEIAYKQSFEQLSAMAERHGKAIKSIMDALKIKRQEEHEELFDFMYGIEEWSQRLIMSGIIIKDAYASTFGTAFYKAFYRVMPEFMRSFGKAFSSDNIFGVIESEAEEAIKKLEEKETIEFAREALPIVRDSIATKLYLADKEGIGDEARLLGRVAIAAPLYHISKFFSIDARKEEEMINAGKFSYLHTF